MIVGSSFVRWQGKRATNQIRAAIHANGPAADTTFAMRRKYGAAGPTAVTDPAGAWIEEWRQLIPPRGVWWRKSAFDLARARRTKRLRPWRWLTEPASTFRVWLATGRLSPAKRARWNRRAEAAAAADPLLSALDRHQRRAAACFEDRAMVTAGAGSGKTRTMVARAGYAARRLGTPPEEIAIITFTSRASGEIRQRTRERLPGLQVGTIHQLARRVLKLVDGRTIQLSSMAEDDAMRRRRIAGWIREEIARDPGLVADIELRRNARAAVVKYGEPVERYRIPPDNIKVRSYGEFVIGTLLHTAGVPFKYEATFPLPAGKPGDAAGADAPPADLRDYQPDFYLPDDPKAPVTADGGVWLEHYAHDRSGRPPADFAGYEEGRAWKRRQHEKLSTRYVETTIGDLQRAWDGTGPGMAEVLVERLRAVGVEIDDPERWSVDAADDISDGPDAAPGPLTLEVDAWIGAVRRQPAGRPPPTGRADVEALRHIGRAVRRRYEQELADTGTTDHDGTILEATDAARRRPDLLPWRHVIVDEYQDVNPAQAAFLHALTTPKGPEPSGEGATLMGVGDDWQAIFGFQGGDVSLIRTTADPAKVVRTLCEPITLVNGYRFGQGLADATRAVVTMDPKARNRRIRGLGPEPVGGVPPVSVTWAKPTPALAAELGPTPTPTTAAVLAAFAYWIPEHEATTEAAAAEPVTVLVMGRRNIDVSDPPRAGRGGAGLDRRRLNAAAREYGLEVEYRTIHAAKGAEADYAVLIDSGVPRSATAPAQLALDRAIAAETRGSRDDEHQLWYVALTRARYAALIVVSDPDGGASPVTRAIIESTDPRLTADSNPLDTWLERVRKTVPCPCCSPRGVGTGRLRLRATSSRTRHFAGCTNWNGGEGCDYTQPACDACDTGMLVETPGGLFECSDPSCGSKQPGCRCRPPRPMVVRRQKRTQKRFWGCWRYGEADACGRTRPID